MDDWMKEAIARANCPKRNRLQELSLIINNCRVFKKTPSKEVLEEYEQLKKELKD